ncbi:MAG: ATP-dependent helicase [Planctomycetota bacterium]|jgi:DNA helicase-2/ATP-dependent DNA helicase PcrA
MTTPREGILEGLTEPQREAVCHLDGPLLVLAGPGSGKTTVVTRRVAWLVSQGIPAWQILGLTFTNKAAGEMGERIDRLVPADVPGRRGLTIATFHSFCARLLRRYASESGLSERFTIYDASDQRDAIKRAMSAAGLSTKNWTPASVAGAISNAKNRLLDADGFASEAGDFYTRSIARAFLEYERLLRTNDAADFDDLLVRTARLLRDNEPVRRELQDRYQYLLIDEYQDTNHAQFVIANSLAIAHRNICVVGDPDQSIYGWRGADISNILEFEDQYPDARVIPLGQNFRSTGHIVGAAAALIRHNRRRKDKKLHTDLGDGEMPEVITCGDEHHEASLIVDRFRSLHEDGSIPWKDMAVLYRVNALSRVMEEAFRDAHVPYVIARGTAFYERKEVKDALGYLRLIANPNDEVSLRRIINTPTRGIGKTTLNKVEAFAIHHQLRFFEALRDAPQVPGLTARAVSSIRKFVTMVDGWLDMAGPGGGGILGAAGRSGLAHLVERVVRESGLEKLYQSSKSVEDRERLENLEELISAAADFEPALPEGLDERGAAEAGAAEAGAADMTLGDRLRAYLESVALVSDADMVDPSNGAVTLMTLHAAKGLEFEAVSIAGLEEGLLPHIRAASSDVELEEERRLCFVGITRAKRRLLLTSAAARTHRGIRERTIPSAFLRELPEQGIVWSDQSAGEFVTMDDDFVYDQTGGAGRRSRAGVEASGLAVGCLVRHPKFGVGRVEAMMPRPVGSSARVSFQGVGVKTLILEYAKLERIG